MIKLVHVSAENFRSLGHISIHPAIDPGSMTAFTGPNGSGKSSVVHAIAWCLYGQTPDGVTVSGIRRQGADPSDECHVIVEFEHHGQTIRVMRAVKGARNASIAVITVDGVEASVASTKTATNWIVNRLGVDYQGFLTSTLVLQKDLESLTRMRAADRKRLVERLAGIDRMSEAANLARDHENAVKRELQSMPDLSPEVADTMNTIAVLQGEHSQLVNTQTQREMDFDRIRGELDVHQQALCAAEEASNTANEIQVRILRLKQSTSAARARIEEWESQLVSLQTSNPSATQDGPPPTPEHLKEQIDTIRSNRNRVSNIGANLASLMKQTESNRADIQATRQQVDTLHEQAAALEKFDPALLTQMQFEVEQAQQQIEILTEDIGAKRGEYEQMQAAIRGLEGTQSTCPTCQQSVPNREQLVETLRNALATITESGTAAKEFISTHKHELEVLTRALKEAETSHQSLQQCHSRIEQTEDHLVGLLTRAQALEFETIALENELSQLPAALELDSKEETLQRALAEATNAAEARQTTKDLQVRLSQLKTSLQADETELAPLELKLSETLAKSATLDHARTAVATAATELAETQSTITGLQANLTITVNRLETKTSELNQLECRQQKRDQAVQELSTATLTREGLTTFRDNRLAHLTPELSEISTDLISVMTGGMYTSVRFDENFTAYLKCDNGNERPASWLSGGEEALVALSMRLAIGEVLTGGQGGLLVLDEVLTAQDAERRNLTMGVLRDLPSRQVVMINHVTESSDLADIIYEFHPDNESGSTVSQPEPASISGDLFLDA